jgi:BRCT domain, a BRCA1 C-terminus domain
MLGATVTD